MWCAAAAPVMSLMERMATPGRGIVLEQFFAIVRNWEPTLGREKVSGTDMGLPQNGWMWLRLLATD